MDLETYLPIYSGDVLKGTGRKNTCGNVCALYKILVSSEETILDDIESEVQTEPERSEPPPNAEQDDIGILRIDEQAWIHERAHALKLKISVRDHCNNSGHQG